MFSAMSSKLKNILKSKADKRESAQKFKQLCLDYARTNDGRKLTGSNDYDAEHFLWNLLDPSDVKHSLNADNLERIKIFIAAGDSLEEYAQKVKEYDDSVMCGFVWSHDYLAYRCRTCALSGSTALCSDCFLAGDHTGHDFNMFRSQAGGACDCGAAQVLKESGFCPKHGSNAAKTTQKPPDELFCTFDIIVPHILQCLLLIFSIHDKYEAYEDVNNIYKSAEELVNLLQTYSDYGAAAKDRLTSILLNKKSYELFSDGVSHFKERSDFITKCRENYKNLAIKSPDSICTKEDAEVLDCPLLYSDLNHVTYLDELMFWLAKLKLPESLLKFMLSSLPCKEYRTPFINAFAQHYTRMISLITKETMDNSEVIPNRVVHISVQLLSNDLTAFYMAEEHKFLRVLVASLYNIVKRCLTECILHTTGDNFHLVVNCRHRLIDGRRYWVATHDLRNALSHKQVALLFLRDPLALELWCDLISVLQGMYTNVREMAGHVEHEDRSYYAPFTAELEMCAFVSHSLLEHLKDESSFDCILSVLQNAISQIQDWFDLIHFRPQTCWKPPLLQCCFHIPLHRLYSSFLWRALKLNAPVPFPSETFLRQLIMHPLCIQVARSEISCDMWVRNGISIRYQSYLYTHSCHAFVDLDLYLLQICSSKINPDWFILTAFERFHLVDWLSFSPIVPVKSFLRTEWEMPMLESCLTLIATLATNYMCLGMSEEECIRMEIAISLFQSDKSYSQLLDSLPYEFAEVHHHTFTSTDIEKLVNELADYVAPQFESGGTMSEGMYVPKGSTWEKYFDPLIIMLRCLQTKYFQLALERYQKYLKSKNPSLNLKSMRVPYRLPDNSQLQPVYANLNKLLHCKTLQAIIYNILLKALVGGAVSENALSLAIFLLELIIHCPNPESKVSEAPFPSRRTVIDLQYCGWFSTGNIWANLHHKIDRILSVDNVPGLSRSCQEETDQGDFPDLIRLRAKLTNREMFNNSDMALVSTASSSRSSEIPYIDSSMEVDSLNNDAESDFFYNKAMSFVPARLRRQYFVTGPSEQSEDNESHAQHEDSLEDASPGSPEVIPSLEEPLQPQALVHEERLAIESSQQAFEDEDANALVVRPVGELSATIRPCVVQVERFLDSLEDQVPLPDSEKLKQLPEPGPAPKALPQPRIFITNAGFSLITLLIELHNKLSPAGSIYKPCPIHNSTTDDDVEMTDVNDDSELFSRIGDNAFFIRQILNKIYITDEQCRKNIDEFCQVLNKSQDQKDAQEKESYDKRRKSAKERQQRLMAQFTSKQKTLFDKLMQKEAAETLNQRQQSSSTGGDQGAQKSAAEILQLAESEYERDAYRTVQCVICSCPASLANDEYPVGLIVSVQSSSIVSKLMAADIDSKDENFEANFDKFCNAYTRAQFEDDFYKRLNEKYSTVSCLTYTNSAITTGFYVQTCGHYVHCECHETYMAALQTDAHQRRNTYLQIDKGEFHCPVCRRFSNAILPVYPDWLNNDPEKSIFDPKLEHTSVSRDEKLSHEIGEMFQNFSLHKISKKPISAKLENVSKRFTSHFLSHLFHLPWMDDFGLQWQFLCNVIHANLEIVSLLKTEDLDQGRPCLAELLNLIANQIDSYEDGSDEERVKRNELDWASLTGSGHVDNGDLGNSSSSSGAPPIGPFDRLETTIGHSWLRSSARPLATPNNEIPLLFRDPVTLLIRFSLIFIHENVSLEHFHNMVMYLLRVVTCQICINEVVSKVSSKDENDEDQNLLIAAFAHKASNQNLNNILNCKSIIDFLCYISKQMSAHYKMPSSDIISQESIDEQLKLIELKLINLHLPFLRLASLLKFYIYQYYAAKNDGNKDSMDALIMTSSSSINPSLSTATAPLKGLYWNDAMVLRDYVTGGRRDWLSLPGPIGHVIINDWLDKAHIFNDRSSWELVYHWVAWRKPRLLPLPQTYDPLFRKFYERRCPNCSRAPKDALLCLMCGQLTCGPGEKCCRSEVGGLSEVERHSADCNSGTGLFLCVQTSLVTILRKRRHTDWGSPYLDAHGEVDRGLKRGRPLFLSQDRLTLLRKQWLMHSFDDTCKHWSWNGPQNRFVAGGIIIDN